MVFSGEGSGKVFLLSPLQIYKNAALQQSSCYEEFVEAGKSSLGHFIGRTAESYLGMLPILLVRCLHCIDPQKTSGTFRVAGESCTQISEQ